MRAPIIRAWKGPVDAVLFAGGGGTCTGLKMATGRSPYVAINHNPKAIAMHKANHPETKHYVEDVHDVDPVDAVDGQECGALWLSPDCTFHSKARGGKPFRDRNRARRVRGLAWIAHKWAKAVKPAVIFMENVEELQDWGPLGPDNRPDPARKGETFRRWVAGLRNLGYEVEWRELRACDYGSPTSRKRLFVVARRDGKPIRWPVPTHGKGRPKPHRAAAEFIDFSRPAASIFLTPEEARAWAKQHGLGVPRRPLSPKTMARIARGVDRFVVNAAEPFIVPVTHGGGEGRCYPITEPIKTITGAHRGEFALVAPTLIQTSYGERKGQAPRVLDIQQPLGTVVAGGIKHSLVTAHLAAAFIAKHNGGHEATGQQLTLPADTICTRDQKALVAAQLQALGTEDPGRATDVRAFLMRYNGTRTTGQHLFDPISTIDTTDRFALVMVHGVAYVIVDITMRMLTPRELFGCTGFPPDYIIDKVADGIELTAEEQVHMCGNAVPPDMAAALFAANHPQSARPESVGVVA